jgi:hypothetical protein
LAKRAYHHHHHHHSYEETLCAPDGTPLEAVEKGERLLNFLAWRLKLQNLHQRPCFESL